MAQTQTDSFKITSITDGIVTVAYTFAGLTTAQQKLAGLTLDDEQALSEQVVAYGCAYKTGLEQEKAAVTPSSEVEALQDQSTLLEGE